MTGYKGEPDGAPASTISTIFQSAVT